MSTARRARLAFIGCGSFATASIFPQIQLIPEIDLVAVCDLDEEKAQRNARNFGARRVYTDMEKMLDTEELDGVFTIGPAPQQYQLAPVVLRRGLPVYVEKPSANTSAEAKELAELAEANGTWGQVGFMKRFADVYRIAKEVIARPEFGGLHVLKVKFGQGKYPQIWGIDSAKRAFLIGQCVHILDLVRFFGGDVRAVNALYYEVGPQNFSYLINLEFVNGSVGHMDINTLDSKVGTRDIIETLELIGMETHLVCEDMMKVKYQPQEAWSAEAPRLGRYNFTLEPSWTGLSTSKRNFGYTGEVEHFARRCLGLETSGPDLWDSYKALTFGEAVYKSSHGGGRVLVEQ